MTERTHCCHIDCREEKWARGLCYRHYWELRRRAAAALAKWRNPNILTATGHIKRRVHDTNSVAWMQQAACKGMDPNLFHPQYEETDKLRQSVRVCREQCPVRDDCLAYALNNNLNDGVWGGTSPEERRAIRRSLIA